jgi:hypothetical protein
LAFNFFSGPEKQGVEFWSFPDRPADKEREKEKKVKWERALFALLHVLRKMQKGKGQHSVLTLGEFFPSLPPLFLPLGMGGTWMKSRVRLKTQFSVFIYH